MSALRYVPVTAAVSVAFAARATAVNSVKSAVMGGAASPIVSVRRVVAMIVGEYVGTTMVSARVSTQCAPKESAVANQAATARNVVTTGVEAVAAPARRKPSAKTGSV